MYVHWVVTAFEWDEAKAQANERKHGVLFSDEAVSILDDPAAITVTDQDSDPSEQRFITIGLSFKARVIVVVYTYPTEETIRIISARKATSQEEREYFDL